jgi:hypothetical protein
MPSSLASDEGFDVTGAVEQTVFGVDVKVDEWIGHVGISGY